MLRWTPASRHGYGRRCARRAHEDELRFLLDVRLLTISMAAASAAVRRHFGTRSSPPHKRRAGNISASRPERGRRRSLQLLHDGRTLPCS